MSKTLLFAFFLSLPFITFSQNLKRGLNTSDTSFLVFKNPDNTYGYKILVRGSTLINQRNIPGQAGFKGFSRKADATKIAALVMTKLKYGEMPPTIKENELKKLQIKY